MISILEVIVLAFAAVISILINIVLVFLEISPFKVRNVEMDESKITNGNFSRNSTIISLTVLVLDLQLFISQCRI